MKDPRPELKEDSALWERAFELASHDPDFVWLLHGFRCMGTRIERDSRGYVLRPLVDRQNGFFEGEYEVAREKYLKPYASQIIGILNELETIPR